MRTVLRHGDRNPFKPTFELPDPLGSGMQHDINMASGELGVTFLRGSVLLMQENGS